MSKPQRRAPKWATSKDIERVSAQWTDEQIECRDLGHHWQPIDAIHVARLHFYRVSHECARCLMVRIRELSERGHVYAQSYRYPDGYLAEGVGRIAGDAKDAIRLASIRRYGATELRGTKDEDTKPRFGATRKGVNE